jgi:hypothetical protein
MTMVFLLFLYIADTFTSTGQQFATFEECRVAAEQLSSVSGHVAVCMKMTEERRT